MNREPSSRNADFVIRLMKPDAWPCQPTKVELIETHISWVFLTDTSAYKVKKPVKFDFLDFSTPDLRRAACETEIAVNRRLAPNVYEKIVPICRLPAGRLWVDGEGDVIDWAVQMKRLPAEQAADVMIREGRFGNAEFGNLCELLLPFYDALAPAAVAPDRYLDSILRHVYANRAVLSDPRYGFDAEAALRIHSALLNLIHLAPDLFTNRVRQGRVVQGHGDLRPEHLYFTPNPVAIDAIEFSTEFRTVDIIDELAFLAIECERLGASWIGCLLIDHYLRSSGDRPIGVLIRFFKCYRACVRAKVAAIQSDQAGSAEAREELLQTAREYLAIADNYAEDLCRPVVLAVCGISGSGKSTVANEAVKLLECDLLRTDELRKEMFADEPPQPYAEGKYSETCRRSVYDELLHRADQKIASGRDVVLEGVFSDQSIRQHLASICTRRRARLIFVQCECPPNVAAQRIESRAKAHGSQAQPELPFRQSSQFADFNGLSVCRPRTDQPLEATMSDLVAELRLRLFHERPTASPFI